MGNTNVEPNWYSPLLLEQNKEELMEQNNEQVIQSPFSSPEVTKSKEDNSEGQFDSNIIQWEDSEKKLNDIMNILKEDFEKNPKDVSEAIRKMHSTFKCLKTGSSRLSVLHNFSKIQHSNIRAGRKSTSIPVQPTAISRRRFVTGSRRCQQTGRPAKKSFVAEHSYGKRKRQVTGISLVKKNKSSSFSPRMCRKECAIGQIIFYFNKYCIFHCILYFFLSIY